jgi:hypothetical protein
MEMVSGLKFTEIGFDSVELDLPISSWKRVRVTSRSL